MGKSKDVNVNTIMMLVKLGMGESLHNDELAKLDFASPLNLCLDSSFSAILTQPCIAQQNQFSHIPETSKW